MANQKTVEEVLKEFEKEVNGAVSANRNLWEGTEQDNIYSVDIHIWRKPGMGNSMQTIAGNQVSIMTATSSFLETLLRKKVITEEELDHMIKIVKESINKPKTSNKDTMKLVDLINKISKGEIREDIEFNTEDHQSWYGIDDLAVTIGLSKSILNGEITITNYMEGESND